MSATSLVFIHGFPQDSSLWDEQVAHFSPHRRTLAPDLRGFGKDRGPIPTAMTMEEHATDIRRVLDSEGVDQAVLCGLSMGGYVALAFAEQWPERLAGLVLCNTRATADPEEGRVAREQTAQDAIAHGSAVIARAMVPKVLSAGTMARAPETAGRMLAMMERQRPDAIASAARGMAVRPDRTRMLSRISVPTLIITGGEDALMPLPTSEAMHAAIPNSRLVIIDGAAHITCLESPHAFNEALDQFLDDLDLLSSA